MRRKVLVIDGGGIKGVIPVAFLAEIERKLKVNVREYFDLIVGTSTGGIIALGLGLGFSAEEILTFYRAWGPRIFPRYRFRLGTIGHLFTPKYDIRDLESAIRSVFGDKLLGHSKSRLVIPSYDVHSMNMQLWKTAHLPQYRSDYLKPVYDIALSTAAAPSYFRTYRASNGQYFVDGGILANSPVLIAIIEAVYLLGWPATEIDVLNLGCSDSPVSVGVNKHLGTGLWQWKDKAIDLFLHAQEQLSRGVAGKICPNIWRISPLVSENEFKLDDVSKIPDMIARMEPEARRYVNEMEKAYFSQKAEPFIPCYPIEENAMTSSI